MNTSMIFVFQLCKHILSISIPVEIRFREKGKNEFENNAAAWCIAKYRKDKVCGAVVNINMEQHRISGYCLNTTLAHEMVHVAQYQHGIMGDNYHDDKFQQMGKILEKGLAESGYPIETIYDPAIDTQ